MRAILLGPHVAVMSSVPVLPPVQLSTNLHEVSHCPEKAPISAFTIENLRHYIILNGYVKDCQLVMIFADK